MKAENHLHRYSCHVIVASFSEQLKLKNKILLLFVQTYQKGKRFHIWKCHVTMTEKGRNLLIWKSQVTRTKNDAYISYDMQLQNQCLTCIHKNKSLLSATSILSRSPMAYNTTASLDKQTCTKYVDSDQCQDRFGNFFWSKNDSNYLDVKLKVFKKVDNKKFGLVQNLTMGEPSFNQFMRLRNQLVNAAENFAGEEKLTPVLIPTMSKDTDEQLRLAHKLVNVVDRANKEIFVTLLRYNVDKPETSYAQVQLFPRKKEGKKFQQVVYVNYKREKIIYLLDDVNSANDKAITNQPICNVL